MLLRRFLIGDNTEVSIIECVAMYAMNVVAFKPFFGLFLQYLWDEKVVGDEAVLMWKEQVEEEGVNEELLNDESVKKIVEYLQDSESSDSSYESESSYSESSYSSESDESESGEDESESGEDESESDDDESESDDDESDSYTDSDSSVC